MLVRTKEIYDGAVPSGNSVAALNLLRIGRITANPEIKNLPVGHTQLMFALNFAFGPSYEVVVAGVTDADDTKTMLKILQQHCFYNRVILFRPVEEPEPEIVELAGYTKFYNAINGKATAYVCKNYACNSPTTDVSEMIMLLNKNN